MASRQRRSTKGSVIATPHRLREVLQKKKTQGGGAESSWQPAGGLAGSSTGRPATAGPRLSEEEDLQWAKAAMLSSDQLSEHLSAIAAKATAVPVAEHLSSTFYLDDIKHLHSPAKVRPRTSSSTASNAADPFAAMACELGVELRTPRTLLAERKQQLRERQLLRQQTLNEEINEQRTRPVGAGVPRRTNFLSQGSRKDPLCGGGSLRASASLPIFDSPSEATAAPADVFVPQRLLAAGKPDHRPLGLLVDPPYNTPAVTPQVLRRNGSSTAPAAAPAPISAAGAEAPAMRATPPRPTRDTPPRPPMERRDSVVSPDALARPATAGCAGGGEAQQAATDPRRAAEWHPSRAMHRRASGARRVSLPSNSLYFSAAGDATLSEEDAPGHAWVSPLQPPGATEAAADSQQGSGAAGGRLSRSGSSIRGRRASLGDVTPLAIVAAPSHSGSCGDGGSCGCGGAAATAAVVASQPAEAVREGQKRERKEGEGGDVEGEEEEEEEEKDDDDGGGGDDDDDNDSSFGGNRAAKRRVADKIFGTNDVRRRSCDDPGDARRRGSVTDHPDYEANTPPGMRRRSSISALGATAALVARISPPVPSRRLMRRNSTGTVAPADHAAASASDSGANACAPPPLLPPELQVPLHKSLAAPELLRRCSRPALARLQPLLKLVAPQLFGSIADQKRDPIAASVGGSGALSRASVELLLRALLGALPEAPLLDELVAICQHNLPDRHGRRAPVAPGTLAAGGALYAPLVCALAPLVDSDQRSGAARFWFSLLDHDADGALGGNDLFHWLRAPAPTLQQLIDALVRMRRQGGSSADGDDVGIDLRTFADALARHANALPAPRAHDAALWWLRRELGEADLRAVEAIQDLPAELMRSIVAKSARVIDLFRAWDTDGDGRIDRTEMMTAMAAEGVALDGEGMRDQLWAIFDPLGEGSVDFKSLSRTLKKAAADVGTDDSAAKRPATSPGSGLRRRHSVSGPAGIARRMSIVG